MTVARRGGGHGRHTCDPSEVYNPFRVARRKVKVLCYLLEDEDVPHEEELSIEDRNRRALRLQRVCSIYEGLPTQVHRFLRYVVENCGLPSEVR